MVVSHREPTDKLWVALPTVVLSFLLPGLGFIVTKRRILGSIILAIWLLGISFVGYLYFAGYAKQLFVTLLSSEFWLNFAIWAIPAFGLVYVAIYFLQVRLLIPFQMVHKVKKGLAWTLAGLLVAGFVIPVGLGTDYTVRTKDLMDNVFATDAVTSLTDSPQSIEAADLWAGEGRVNVLVIGSDAGSDRVGVRADIIVIASINTQNGDMTLFSLPRNLENVPFPESSPLQNVFPRGFNDLINAVWTYAEARPDLYPDDPQRGLTATKEAVEGATGLAIDYSLVINMQGFQDFVDAIGGVTIDVPRDLPIGISGRTPVDYVRAGDNQQLNGWQALWYVRSRADSNDYDRMERTKCMIQTLTNTVSPQELVIAYPLIIDAIHNNFYTDIPQNRLTQWVDLLERVQGGFVRAVAFTDDLISPGNPDFNYIHETVTTNLEPVTVIEETTPGNNPVQIIEKIGSRKEDAEVEPIGEYC